MNKKEFSNNSSKIERPINPAVELEMKHRFLDAKELGRVCPQDNPDYIGNFSSYSPAGIFELSIIQKDEEGNFKGIIKDCYGNATTDGKISNLDISFTKHYIPEESSIRASRIDLKYQGSWCLGVNLDFTGEWSYKGFKKPEGYFWLSKDLLN